MLHKYKGEINMDFFKDYSWHSSLQINDNIRGKKKIARLTNNKTNRNRFLRVAKDSDFLIHKATKALWKVSDDGESLVPVFEDDILTQDNL